ncbi:hypothetical protein H5V45_02785 [Nocardioides sp. KIGAM211]|uniref:Uncharacterized protein n=1 Tax=Nocardioides luti TaxID=2761101 RepID=A0A7X0RFT5_9ACTN|nr:hypothetical protein [Nocardioides luti]MBB6626239.1 hypothetical protein [Nocardioides luti]
MYVVDYASMRFFLLYASEALVFLAVAVFCARHLRQELWAGLGLAGGLVGGLAALLYAYGWARVEWADDLGVLEFISAHDSHALSDWARPVGLALVAAALVAAAAVRRDRG